MTAAHMFWVDELYDCQFEQSLSLPYDRYYGTNNNQIGSSIRTSIKLNDHLSHQILNYSLLNNIPIQHLLMSTYFILLLKLTNGERNLCIGTNVDNRYKSELKSMIGLFENLIPVRCQLEPHWSIHQTILNVDDKVKHCLEYSYYPLQFILDLHGNASKFSFLSTFFEVLPDENVRTIGNSQLSPMIIPTTTDQIKVNSKFGFNTSFLYDIDASQFSCITTASLDLFSMETVDEICRRFHKLLCEIFEFLDDRQQQKRLWQLSFVMPDEVLLMKALKNTKISDDSVHCVHHEFASHMTKQSQKLAVELDDQSLTYAELLHYSHTLSLYLLKEQRVTVGEAVCQCVNRSLSMVG